MHLSGGRSGGCSGGRSGVLTSLGPEFAFGEGTGLALGVGAAFGALLILCIDGRSAKANSIVSSKVRRLFRGSLRWVRWLPFVGALKAAAAAAAALKASGNGVLNGVKTEVSELGEFDPFDALRVNGCVGTVLRRAS